MTNIKQTDIMPPAYLVAGRMYHQARGDERPRVARLYTVSKRRDGSNLETYMLTRYVTKLGVAMSAILKVTGVTKDPLKDMQLEEVCREDRKNEEKMIIAWYQEQGSLDFGRPINT